MNRQDDHLLLHQQIHQPQLVRLSDDQVKAGGVKGNAIGLALLKRPLQKKSAVQFCWSYCCFMLFHLVFQHICGYITTHRHCLFIEPTAHHTGLLEVVPDSRRLVDPAGDHLSSRCSCSVFWFQKSVLASLNWLKEFGCVGFNMYLTCLNVFFFFF